MMMNLSEEVRLLALDTLTGGWFRYGKLSDGVQIRCTWQQEGPVRWLQVENLETGEKNLFTLDVTVQPTAVTIRPIGPEDDGALRAELSAFDPDYPGCAPEECGGSRLDPCVTVMKTRGKAHDGEVEDHPFTVGEGATAMVCTAMVMRDGGGDSCGLPASAHLKETWAPMHYWPGDGRAFGCDTDSGLRSSNPDSVTCPQCMIKLTWPTECANCAPLAAGASATRVDGTESGEPCEDCRLTYPDTWAEVRTGDQVQGEDGAWYDVVRSGPSTLVYRSVQVVTLLIGDREHTYDMPGAGPVRIKLGEEHRAIRNLKAGFPGTEEVR